jgi:hypothetical protein
MYKMSRNHLTSPSSSLCNHVAFYFSLPFHVVSSDFSLHDILVVFYSFPPSYAPYHTVLDMGHQESIKT